jgi:hypothetical protein
MKKLFLATSFASIFAEVSSDEMMGLGIGISYAPEVVDLDKETRTYQNCTDNKYRHRKCTHILNLVMQDK